MGVTELRRDGKSPDLITLEETGEQVELLYSENDLREIRTRLATEIISDHKDQFGSTTPQTPDRGKLIILTVQNGAIPFSQDMQNILGQELNFESDSIKLSSYGTGTESSGQINLDKDMEHKPSANDTVVIMEDIVDTGLTMKWLIEYLQTMGVKNIKICSLFSKSERRTHSVEIDYLGDEIPDRYVFGYGMDANGKYRNLPFVVAYPQAVAA